MVELTNAEKETHLNMTGDDHTTWSVVMDDPYWIRRMEAVGAEFVRNIGYGSKEYRLEANQVRFFKPISDAQRTKMAAHLIAAKTVQVD